MSQQEMFNESMSSPGDSPAKTSALPEKWEGSKQKDPGFGAKWGEPFARYDPDMRSLRTWQISLDSDWNRSCPILPKWGEMRHGLLYPHPLSEQIIAEIESSSSVGYPTLSATEGKGATQNRFRGSRHYKGSRMVEALRNGPSDPQYLSIPFGTAQMGFPPEYISKVCEELATLLSPKSATSSDEQ